MQFRKTIYSSEETHDLGRVIRKSEENRSFSIPVMVTYRIDKTEDGRIVESVRFERELSQDKRYGGKHLFIRITFPNGMIRWQEYLGGRLRERPANMGLGYWEGDIIYKLRIRAPEHILGVLGLEKL